MKKSLLIKLISVFLISVFLLSYLATFSAGAVQLIEDLVMSSKVSSLRKDAVMMSYNSFVQSDFVVNEGLTVVYGENIDVEVIKQKTEKRIKTAPSNMAEHKKTYMIMYMKKGDFLDIKYVSVSYADNVNPDSINQFISSQLSDKNFEKKIDDFLNEQVNSAGSALNRSTVIDCNVSTCATASTQNMGVVENVRDQGYYIDNYETLLGDHPLVIYEKDITYEAWYVPNSMEDNDLYYIVARVYVTPGNDYENLNGDYDGVENEDYGDKIIVCGAKTQFFNLFPNDGDFFIDMWPNNNGISQSDVNGEEIEVSISSTGEVSISFTITAPSDETVINMVTHFEADDISYVEFLTEKKYEHLLSETYPPIAEARFYYKAVVYMNSSWNTLYTKAGTGIYYCFTNDDTSLRFAGSAQEIYYEAE